MLTKCCDHNVANIQRCALPPIPLPHSPVVSLAFRSIALEDPLERGDQGMFPICDDLTDAEANNMFMSSIPVHPRLLRRSAKKSTATRLSPMCSAATLISVVTSSPRAFSARGYCVTTCTLPTFFLSFSPPLSFYLSIPIQATHSPTCSPTDIQLPKRSPRTAACAPPLRSARRAHPLRALRRRADLRRES
jgi:hypothetical protein